MPLKTNLISYWKLNEASGNALDAHGGNALTAYAAPGSTTGKVGGARTFNGSGQKFSIADNPALSTGDIDFTIACWVKLNATGASSILGKESSTGTAREYSLDLNTGLRYRFYVFDSSGTFASVEANSYGSLTTGTWTFIVAWHDSVANTINIQVNNGTVDSVAHSTGVRDETAKFDLGSRNAIRYLDGSLDETGFWKRVLTSDERTALYNSGSGKSYDNFDPPLNLTAPVLNIDGTVTSGTWDSQSNGTITRTTYLRLASDDSLVATLFTANPDFSSYVTPGTTYYVVERASNDGGYDEAEDTQSANTTIAASGETIELTSASEVETSYTLTIAQPKTILLGIATEIESGYTLTIGIDQTIPLSTGFETELSYPISVVNPKSYQLNLTSEVESVSSLIINIDQTIDLGITNENETANTLTILNPKTHGLGIANEIETPYSISTNADQSIVLGNTTETESLHSLSILNPKTCVLNTAPETETTYSLSINNPRTYSLGNTTETESSYPLSVTNDQSISLQYIEEVETAYSLTITNPRAYQLRPPQEIESATTLTIVNPRAYTLENVGELETVFAMSINTGNQVPFPFYYYEN